MLENTVKIPFIRGSKIIQPLLFDPKDKQEGEIFNLVDEKVLKNVETGRYLVSNMGRIYDIKLNKYKNPVANCNAKRAHKQPYYKTKFNYNIANDYHFQQKDVYFHRAVAKSFLPNKNSEYLEVDHINGDHADNRVENLEWVDGKENKQRALERDYILSCEDQPRSVLTNEQVHKICKLLIKGYNSAEIARIFKVNQAIIHDIKIRKSYAKIGYKYNLPEAKPTTTNILPDEIVHKICKRLSEGESCIDIGKEFNVSRHVVNNIRNRRNYRRISEQYNFEAPKLWRPLSNNEIEVICKRLENGDSVNMIATAMNLSITAVNNIKNGKRHKDISSNYNIPKPGEQFISDDVVRIICVMIQRGFPNKSIYNFIGGKETGISLAIISNIRNHKSGNHISKDFNF